MAVSESIWAIVPAAGIGSRMASTVPKQYLPLAGRCVLQVTLDKLLSVRAIQRIFVAVSESDELFEKHISVTERIERVKGGSDRAGSVFSGLEQLMARGYNQDWVLVHDAARPCFSIGNLEKLMSTTFSSPAGAILAAKAADTMKKVVESRVERTLNREEIWMAHTPQIFRVGELYGAMRLGLANKWVITDESSAMELAGYSPIVLEDSRDNIKITRAEDLALAEWIIQNQKTTAS